MIANNLAKSVPSLGLFLNTEEWQIKLNKTSAEIDMGYWVTNADKIISRIPDHFVPFINKECLLNADDIFEQILRSRAASAELVRDRPAFSDCEQELVDRLPGVTTNRILENIITTEQLIKLLYDMIPVVNPPEKDSDTNSAHLDTTS
jgi:hypothetical protein